MIEEYSVRALSRTIRGKIMSETNSRGLPEAELLARARIGKNVVYFSLGATTVLGLVAIVVAAFFAKDDVKERFAHVKDILTIILPLIGTWVGTVLAFYFSRENFVAAAQQTAALVKQLTPEEKLQSISAESAMIDLSAEDTMLLMLSPDRPEEAITITVGLIKEKFTKFNRNRLPVLNADGHVLYLLHRSYVEKFLVAKAMNGADIAPLTFRDLLADPSMKTVFESFGTLAVNAKLLAAKQLMDSTSDCADVFLTEDGTRKSKAKGWVTDVIVREKASL